MPYRAKAYLPNTEDLNINLGSWDSKHAAQQACIVHATQRLAWEEPWVGIWQARTHAYWYQVVTTAD